MTFPPNVFLVFRAQERQQIVQVHPNVHEQIRQAEKAEVAACVKGIELDSLGNFYGKLTGMKFDTKPDGKRHHGVMKHVKHRNFIVFFL